MVKPVLPALLARRPVLLLDDDDDLREALAALFEDLGARCLALRSVDELIRAGDDALDCKLAVIDVNLGPSNPSGIDAYAWLKSRAFSGRVVFLTGHARSNPLVATAVTLGVLVLEKPASLSELEALLEA